MEFNSKMNKENAYEFSHYSNKNTDKNYADQSEQHKNLKSKLTNAFSDLDFMKNSLKGIRGTKNDPISKQQSNNQNYDFFSDDRYRSVLDQIKNSNYQDKNKKNTINFLKDKEIVGALLGLSKNSENKVNKLLNNENPKIQSNTTTSKIKTKMEYKQIDSGNNKNISFKREEAFKSQSEFRKLITETQTQKTNKNHDNNDSINNKTTNNSNIYSTTNKYSYISLREEVERLKITNHILTNYNSELKTENLNLNKELELQYQLNRNSIATSALQHQHSNKKLSSNKTEEEVAFSAENEIVIQQYQELIENLKASLETNKKNNEELTDLISKMQMKQSELQKENSSLKEQNNSVENDLEKLNNLFEETKMMIKNQNDQSENLENELSEFKREKRLLEEKLFLAEEQIINLISINESHLKTKKDNLDCIESLKQTIEIIKRGSFNDDENILEAKIKLEEMENTINQKNYVIKSMSDSVNNFEKDREFFNLTLNNLKEEISDKDKFAEEIEEKYRVLYSDFEKTNMKVDTLQVKLDESEQTISNLKTSINFINETMEEYKQDYNNIKSELESEKTEKNKLVKSIEITKEKLADLTVEIEDLQAAKNTLQAKLLETEKALKEKKSMLKKANFEKSNIEQQLIDSKNNIESLKEELKLDKYAKLNEEFQKEIAKSNEERLKKVEDMRAQLENKTKEYEKNQEELTDLIKSKEERIKELTKLLSRAESVNEQNEKNFNEKVFKLNSTLEQQRAEMQTAKFNAESEKRNMQYQSEELQRQLKELQTRLKLNEENYSNLIKKNFGGSTSQVATNNMIDYGYSKKTNEDIYKNVNNENNTNYKIGSSNNIATSIGGNYNSANTANFISSNTITNNNMESAKVGSNFWSSLAKESTSTASHFDYDTHRGFIKEGSTYFSSSTANNMNKVYTGGAAQINHYDNDFNPLPSSYKLSSNNVISSTANSNNDANFYFERLPKTVKTGFDKNINENSDIFSIGNGRLSNIKKKINNEELEKLDLLDVNELLSD